MVSRFLRILVTALVIAFHCGAAAAERPPEWAQPLVVAGVPNLYQIAPGVFRSAQPTAIGMRHLEAMGIRTVISFRHFHDDRELMKGTHLHLIRVPINTWDISDEEVVATLRELKRAADGPFLIHCQHGADRTGLMSAMYRIVVQGWDKQRAVEELTRGGYGYHAIWQNILHYIDGVDVDKIRRQVGN